MTISRDREIDFSIILRLGGVAKRYPAGTEIMHEGEPRTHMFYLHKGKAAVVAKGRVVEEVSEGGIFGEMAMIDYGPRSASVIAKTDCEAVAINEQLFLLLVHQTPFFAIDVMRTLVRRLRQMNAMLAQ
ncbi:MAG TPA: cyclic nucleotide-binding domain-containing protein [Croceibacterium sp.]|jgi:CRP/FNR family transcriptional regulator, cyclic AMP receptor protein|nr:cyclic nucleotide-binding domain-containing protein [Croceibacterium sp.]